MRHAIALAVAFMLVIGLALSAQGAVIYSDSFTGTLGTTINGQNLNNALGGSQAVTWLCYHRPASPGSGLSTE